jgi:hypothetical protein
VCEVEDYGEHDGVDESNNHLASSRRKTQEDTGSEDEEKDGNVKRQKIFHFYVYVFFLFFTTDQILKVR